jgi:hypothetical protein
MDRIKLIALIAVPILIPIAPSMWMMMPAAEVQTTKLGTVSDDRINEASGVAVSRATKNAVWMHNDSGDKPRLFLTGLDGTTKSELELKGVSATDWEDMCSFQLDGKNWLLIGDVGDNQKDRATKREKARLYLVEEPSKLKKRLKIKPTRTIKFEYEDGPHDCEGVTVDVKSKRILLLTKSLLPGGCHLYSMPLNPGKKPVARKIADLPVPIATAMDLSADGRRLVVLTPVVGFMIDRKEDETWGQASRRIPTVMRIPRLPQAEAICFSHDSSKLYMISEGMNQPIWEMVPPKVQK